MPGRSPPGHLAARSAAGTYRNNNSLPPARARTPRLPSAPLPRVQAAPRSMADQQAAPADNMQADGGLQPGIRDPAKPFTL